MNHINPVETTTVNETSRSPDGVRNGKTFPASIIAFAALALAGFFLSSGSFNAAERGMGAGSRARFTRDGQLIQPTDYRRWVYLGAPLTPNDMNEGAAAFPEFHSVYVDPESFDYYLKHGDWRDGTMVVKELISVGSKQAASGHGYFMGDFIGLEAMVKSKKRYPKEPGNWSFFSFTALNGAPPKKQVGALPTAQCNACHATSAKEDLVFSQYYPVLRAAKAGKVNQYVE